MLMAFVFIQKHWFLIGSSRELHYLDM